MSQIPDVSSLLGQIIIICGVLAMATLLSRILTGFVWIGLRRLSSMLPEDISQSVLEQKKLPITLFWFYVICRLGLSFLDEKQAWVSFIKIPFVALLCLSLVALSWQLLNILEKVISRSHNLKLEKAFLNHFLPYSIKILKALSAAIIILMGLQNLGWNVSTLLTGLGLGGAALALASKETLAHFFGGFSVVSDKPFSIGDWIICNDFEGSVQEIGFRSTKIKTFYDSIIAVPNSILANSIIDNMGKRESRRTRVILDLTYDTSEDKIKEFVEGIKQILKNNDKVRQDYFQCYFYGFGPHSLQVLLNFFVKTKDWDQELEVKQDLFLEIIALSKKLEVQFAFPTQTLDFPENFSKNFLQK